VLIFSDKQYLPEKGTRTVVSSDGWHATGYLAYINSLIEAKRSQVAGTWHINKVYGRRDPFIKTAMH
jgi:hypothetical protein